MEHTLIALEESASHNWEKNQPTTDSKENTKPKQKKYKIDCKKPHGIFKSHIFIYFPFPFPYTAPHP